MKPAQFSACMRWRPVEPFAGKLQDVYFGPDACSPEWRVRAGALSFSLPMADIWGCQNRPVSMLGPHWAGFGLVRDKFPQDAVFLGGAVRSFGRERPCRWPEAMRGKPLRMKGLG